MPFRDLYVVELESPAALVEESRQLQHCVHLYGDMCRSGLSRIFSVRDSCGRALSTAEIRPLARKSGGVECWLYQHRGVRDGVPEKQCSDAIEALVGLLATEPQASRIAALYLTRGKHSYGTGWQSTDIDNLFSTVESVKKVLELEARGRYEKLVAETTRKVVA